MTLILASGSSARRDLMTRAGYDFEIIPAKVDEDAVKQDCLSRNIPIEETARTLAEAKALAVSRTHRKALVIGSDQMLVCDGRWFDKPADMAQAAAHLAFLQGKSHYLISAVVVAQNQKTLWSHLDQASLTLKPLTDSDIEDYLARSGEAILSSVGCYRLEDGGASLFSHIEGDRSVILGMPLMPLMGFLSSSGVSPA